jgi:hypothetical protein
MSVCAKLYNKLLLERLRDKLDAKLRYNQNGFRSLRSTAQHVLSLRRLFEEVKDSSTAKLVSIFIDFSKAFDSIDWNYIENILLSYGVPNELVEAIMSIYYGAVTLTLETLKVTFAPVGPQLVVTAKTRNHNNLTNYSNYSII